MKVELVDYTQNSELLIENCMRICHGGCAKDEPNKKFIQSVISLGHESPLEHAKATFKISGVSRALTHQLVRHRLSSFTQLSQRYVKEDHFEYVIPQEIEKVPLYKKKFEEQMSTIQQWYNEWIENGVLREDARYVLPNACCTSIYMTSNLRQWRNFIKLRSERSAQKEIRDLSNEILLILYTKVAPSVFEDLYTTLYPQQEVEK